MGDRVGARVAATAASTDGRARRPRPAGRHGAAPSGPGERVALVDLNSEAVPVALFGAALAGKPFVPINYRLTDEQLQRHPARAPRRPSSSSASGVAERHRARSTGIERAAPRDELLEPAGRRRRSPPADRYAGDPDDIAVLLFTSGTTGEPKAAVLRHRHLASYVISHRRVHGRRRGRGRARQRAAVPHRRDLGGAVARVYGGRRIVYLPTFDAERVGRRRRAPRAITHAMVVPTMLGRILDVIEADGERPARRCAHLSYGGGRDADAGHRAGHGPAAARRLRQRLRAHRDQLDHRRARPRRPPRGASPATTPPCARRLGSVGRPLPTVEVDDPRRRRRARSAPASAGEIWVRGEQVSGEYLGRGGGSTRRLVPHQRRRLPRRRRATCSSRAGSTTSSSAAARTSRPARSRRCCSSTPPSPTSPSSASPTPSGARRSCAAVVLDDGAEADRGRAAATASRPSLRSTRTPEHDRLPRRAALQRDRQAPAPRAQGRAGRTRGRRLLIPDAPSDIAGRGLGTVRRVRSPRVVDTSSGIPGAYASLLLHQAGADVGHLDGDGPLGVPASLVAYLRQGQQTVEDATGRRRLVVLARRRRRARRGARAPCDRPGAHRRHHHAVRARRALRRPAGQRPHDPGRERRARHPGQPGRGADPDGRADRGVAGRRVRGRGRARVLAGAAGPAGRARSSTCRWPRWPTSAARNFMDVFHAIEHGVDAEPSTCPARSRRRRSSAPPTAGSGSTRTRRTRSPASSA